MEPIAGRRTASPEPSSDSRSHADTSDAWPVAHSSRLLAVPVRGQAFVAQHLLQPLPDLGAHQLWPGQRQLSSIALGAKDSRCARKGFVRLTRFAGQV